MSKQPRDYAARLKLYQMYCSESVALIPNSTSDSEAREAIHQTMDSYLEDLRVVIHDITESAMQLTFNVAAKKARCKCRE